MSKKMLINATHPEENRVAIVEDGILTELDIEIAGKEQTKGNIYKAAVVRVESGLQAAFVDYGGERLGFLQMGEIHPKYFGNSEKKGRPRINDVLQRGQELLVQIVKEERGTKGAALTTFLSLPGRYMVLMPDSDTKGVSRKINDDSQRRVLKENMASLDLPGDFGYIVRTAGIGQTKEELKRDFTYLSRLYESIQSLNRRVQPPVLVYKESNLIIRSIRDYFSTEMDEVLVDDPKVYEEARDFFQQVMPEYARLVKLHQERRPIFARYQIEEQIETISKSKVPLPSGGSIVIDSTEALVAVDVNSGKLAGEQGVEATAYRTNLEAAAEVGRQLRLRDLGGLIVIDFIDMRERKHDRDVEKRLKQALKNDKARVTVGRISQFGLLEMSRQRIKAALAEGAYLSCPHCNGSGKIKSVEAQAVAFLRKVQAGIAKGQIGTVEGEIPLDVATYLLNTRREELHEMERQRDIEIFIKGHPDFVAGQAELNFLRRRTEKEKTDEVVEAGAHPEREALGSEAVKETAVPATAESAEGAESPAAAEEGNKRKRRRRRRRKPSAERAAAEASGSTAAGAEENLPAPTVTQEPAAVEKPAVGTTEEKASEITEPSPSQETPRPSRSRGRRRKKPESAEKGFSQEPAQDGSGEAPPQKAAPPSGHESENREETASGEQGPASGEAPEKTAAVKEPAPAEPSGEEKVQRPARRRGRPKKSVTEAMAAAAVPGEEKTPASAVEPPAEPAGEPEKPKRPRTRKKPAKEQTVAAEPPVVEKSESAEPALTGQPPQAEEKKAEKKPRRPRKKVATAGEEGAPAPPTTTEPPPVETAQANPPQPAPEEIPPKPVRRGRPRKKTVAEAGEKTASPPDSYTGPSSGATSEAGTETKTESASPKPARRGRPRKKPVAEAGEKTTPSPDSAKEPSSGATSDTPLADTTGGIEKTTEKPAKTAPKKRAPRKKASAEKTEDPGES